MLVQLIRCSGRRFSPSADPPTKPVPTVIVGPRWVPKPAAPCDSGTLTATRSAGTALAKASIAASSRP